MCDPQEVYGGECVRCHNWFADNEEDLDANDRCDECADEVAAEIEEEEAALRESESEVIAPGLGYDPDKWLFIASNITGAGK